MPYAPLVAFGPSVHSVFTRRTVTPSAPLIFTASPLVSCTVMSSSVKWLPLARIPLDPAFWPLKLSTVLSIPLPRSVTLSAVIWMFVSSVCRPSGSSITAPGLALTACSSSFFWKSGPACNPLCFAHETSNNALAATAA